MVTKTLEIMNLFPESVENRLVRKNQNEIESHVEKEERVASESPEQKRQKHDETETLKVNDTTTTTTPHVEEKKCHPCSSPTECDRAGFTLRQSEEGCVSENTVPALIVDIIQQDNSAAYEESQCQGGIDDFLDMY